MIGFRQAETSDRFTRGHGRQEALLLLFTAIAMNGAHGEARLDPDSGAKGRIGALQGKTPTIAWWPILWRRNGTTSTVSSRRHNKNTSITATAIASCSMRRRARTSAWQGLFLQSFCIPAIHGGQMHEVEQCRSNCRDPGAG